MRDLTRELEELGHRNAADVVAPPVARLREAGDRRRRRRHVLTATGAVAGAGLVLAGVLALGPGPLTQSAPPATTGPVPTATAAPPPSTTDAPPVSVTTPPVAATSATAGGATATDRPAGYGAVRLGMTVDHAVATGEARVVRPGLPDDPCTVLELDAGGTAFARDPDRVVEIFFGPQMQTSAGIRAGATLDEVLAAYPGSSLTSDAEVDRHVRVDVRGTADYVFLLDGADSVVSILLVDTAGEVCTG